MKKRLLVRMIYFLFMITVLFGVTRFAHAKNSMSYYDGKNEYYFSFGDSSCKKAIIYRKKGTNSNKIGQFSVKNYNMVSAESFRICGVYNNMIIFNISYDELDEYQFFCYDIKRSKLKKIGTYGCDNNINNRYYLLSNISVMCGDYYPYSIYIYDAKYNTVKCINQYTYMPVVKGDNIIYTSVPVDFYPGEKESKVSFYQYNYKKKTKKVIADNIALFDVIKIDKDIVYTAKDEYNTIVRKTLGKKKANKSESKNYNIVIHSISGSTLEYHKAYDASKVVCMDGWEGDSVVGHGETKTVKMAGNVKIYLIDDEYDSILRDAKTINRTSMKILKSYLGDCLYDDLHGIPHGKYCRKELDSEGKLYYYGRAVFRITVRNNKVVKIREIPVEKSN